MKTSTAVQARPLGASRTVPVPASTHPPSSQPFVAAPPSSSAPPASSSRPVVRSALAQALSSLPPAPPQRQTLITKAVAPSTPSPAAPVAPKPRVIVADPDPAARARVVQMLRDVCDVEEAVDGVQASAMCSAGKVPAMLITDLSTPRMDGFTLAKLMKGHPTLKRVPVVFLAAKASPRDVVVAIGLGARQFINKESSADEISAKLRKIVAS
jgi:CheY-like chemotaxis protein